MEDVDAVRSLRLASLRLAPDSYRRLYADAADVPYDRWEAFVERIVADPDAGVFLAIRRAEPAGMMFVGTDRENETMSIGDMWVEPEQRRHEVAHAMVVAATEWGCLRSARVARLAVTITNEAAERLYLECEFVPTGETEPLRDGSDIAIAWMERTLIS